MRTAETGKGVVEGWRLTDVSSYEFFVKQTPPRRGALWTQLWADIQSFKSGGFIAVALVLVVVGFFRWFDQGLTVGFALLAMYAYMLRAQVAVVRNAVPVFATVTKIADHPATNRFMVGTAQISVPDAAVVERQVFFERALAGELLLHYDVLFALVLVGRDGGATVEEGVLPVIALRPPQSEPPPVPAPRFAKAPSALSRLATTVVVFGTIAACYLALTMVRLRASQDSASNDMPSPSSSGAYLEGSTMLQPPWTMFPEGPTSMRWRMGPGEDYLGVWLPFFLGLPQQQRAEYLAKNPPPTEWNNWLAALNN